VALTFLRLCPAKTKAIVLVDAFLPQPPKDDAARQSQRAQWDSYLKTLAGPDAKDTVGKMIDGMFSSKTTPETRLEIRTKMLAAPTQVRVSAMKGMSELDPPKAGETYQIPVMVFVTEQRPGLDAQLRGIFPNLRSIETWTGYGHFLMMEDPARFNKALEQFLGGL
jgi:pimeloyl-ACP methyl ester carboxylesterase